MLTAAIVANALGDDYDPSVQGKLVMAELQTFLDAPGTKALNLECLKDLTAADFSDKPLRKATKALAEARRGGRLKEVLDSLPTEQHRAWLLSGGGEGACYLMANTFLPGVTGPSSTQFKALVRTRLSLLPTDDTPANLPCPHCNDAVMDPCGLHQLTCKEKGKGNATGLRSTRHAKVKYATVTNLSETAKAGGKPGMAVAVDEKEPVCSHYWEPKEGAALRAELRGDILAKNVKGQGTILVGDLTITHPSTVSAPSRLSASVPGHAAGLAATFKIDHYSKKYAIPPGQFLPLAIETGGRMHSGTLEFFKVFIMGVIGKDNKSDFTAEETRFYNSHFRKLVENVSNAVALETAKALLHKGSVRATQAALVTCVDNGDRDQDDLDAASTAESQDGGGGSVGAVTGPVGRDHAPET
jgi:hypothetical protein